MTVSASTEAGVSNWVRKGRRIIGLLWKQSDSRKCPIQYRNTLSLSLASLVMGWWSIAMENFMGAIHEMVLSVVWE